MSGTDQALCKPWSDSVTKNHLSPSALFDIGFIFILDWLDGRMSDKEILQMDPYAGIIKMNNG